MKLHTVERIVLVASMLVVAFVAGERSSLSVVAQSRQKWEYQIVSGNHTVEKMNKRGEDGWEAITLNASNRVLLRWSK
jgi:hypothetical protein